LREITPDGTVTTLAGTFNTADSADGTGSQASFNKPEFIKIDANGNLYVADSGNSTVREVTQKGVVTSIAGRAASYTTVQGKGAAASFMDPWSLAVDKSGNVYMADFEANSLNVIAPDGTVSVLAANSATNPTGTAPTTFYPYST